MALAYGINGLSFWVHVFNFLSVVVLFILLVATFGPLLSLVAEFWSLAPSESQTQCFTDTESKASRRCHP